MPELHIPAFGTLLAPYIAQVPASGLPRFLALLERGAAERYRHWADTLPQHAADLLKCAASEDEIADRIEAAFALDPALADAIRAPLPAARETYYAVLRDLEVWDQLRVQANAERQGAQAWRDIAAALTDQNLIDQLAVCSALEEASADRLDTLLARQR